MSCLVFGGNSQVSGIFRYLDALRDAHLDAGVEYRFPVTKLLTIPTCSGTPRWEHCLKGSSTSLQRQMRPKGRLREAKEPHKRDPSLNIQHSTHPRGPS